MGDELEVVRPHKAPPCTIPASDTNHSNENTNNDAHRERRRAI